MNRMNCRLAAELLLPSPQSNLERYLPINVKRRPISFLLRSARTAEYAAPKYG